MNETLQRRVTSVATAALLIVALLPYVVIFLPRIYLDVDPLSEIAKMPVTQLGPVAAAWYSTLAVVLAAAIMGWCIALRRAVAWWAVVLVGLGVVSQFIHYMRQPGMTDDLWYGAAWIAGSCLALAAFHLLQLPGSRRWVIAGFVAILLPLTIEAFWFVTVEHRQTIDSYMRQEQQLIDSRGGEPIGGSKELYERRLEAPDVIGTFSLSNVLGSLTMASTLLGIGLTMASQRWHQRLAALLVTAGGAITLYLTHSRGAEAALLAALIVLMTARWLGRYRRLLTIACLGVPAAAVAVVLLVGAMGPPPVGKPISSAKLTLLYRYQYWQGAARICAAHPLIGAGEAGFREQYLAAKNPLSPEDVRSAHNLFVDWIAMLGVGGWAWSVLVIVWLLHAVRGVATERALDEQPPPRGYALWLPCLAVAAFLFGSAYLLNVQLFGFFAVKDDQTVFDWYGTALLIKWLVCLLSFFVLMGWLAGGKVSQKWLSIAALAGAVALVGHNQIEMTYHHMPSVVAAWMLLALGAANAVSGARPRRFDWAIVPGLAAVAVMVVVMVAEPVTQQQQHVGTAVQALQAGRADVALAQFDRAAQYVAADNDVLRWRILLRLQKADALSKFGDSRGAEQARQEALALCDPINYGGNDSYRLDRWRSNVHEALGDLDAAIVDQKRVIERLPYSMPDHMRYADLLAEAGRTAEAAEAYRDVLALSEQRYLDPAVQLNDEQRQRLEAYIEKGVGGRE